MKRLNFVLCLVCTLAISSAARADSAVTLTFGTLNPVSGLDSGVTAVAIGYEHGLAVQNGGAFAWGRNTFGQLGDGTRTSHNIPAPVIGLASGVTAVAANPRNPGSHSLAVQNGAAYAWGGNALGQLGNGTVGGFSSTPALVSGLSSGVTAIAAGYSHSLAVKDGALWAWGWNFSGELGDGTTTERLIPVPVIGMDSGVTAIAAGNIHSLAVKDGGVYAWGGNPYGQLGNGTFGDNSSTPALVSGLSSGATAVAASRDNSFAVVNGRVYAWGDGSNGGLGNGTSGGDGSIPVLVDPTNVTNIIAVAAGGPQLHRNYALSSDGSLWIWGGSIGPFPQHLLPPAGYKFTSISASDRFALATLRAVPEPSTFLLAAAALGFCIAHRRRRAQNDNRNAARTTCRRQQLSIALVLGLSATLCNSAATAHAADIRTVALSGQQAPGKPDGTTFTSFVFLPFYPLVLNDAGQTAFWARTSDSIFPSGIYSEGGGSLNLVAEPGQQAPGLPDGVTYGGFNNNSLRIVISDAGITAFNGYSGASVGNQGIWSSGPSSSALIARVGEQAAGVPAGVVYAGLDFGIPNFVLNDAGQAAFSAILTGGGVDLSNRNGIWAQRHGNLELVARQGTHAPGTPDGVNFDYIGARLALNKFGQTAFGGFLTGSGVDVTNDQGTWSEGSGSLTLVAREGSQAPGMPDGAVFTGFFGLGPAFNNAGQTAFVSSVTGGGVDATNDAGIWSEASGPLALVVRKGSPAPGTPSGVNFRGLFEDLALNDAGQIAFEAILAGAGVDSTNNVGLWSGAPGSLALVARTGDHAPGTEDGVVFRSFTNIGGSNTGPSWMFNAAGQTAFNAQLIGSDGVSAGSGIWATDRSGVLQLVARRGDLLEVAPGDFRTITGVTFNVDSFTNPTGNSDGRPSAFNNLGQLAFRAGFTGGTSGIFVSNRVAVPEPSALALVALAVATLLVRRSAGEGRGRRGTLIIADHHSSGLAEISVD